jgi:hypothetical protein
MSLPLLLVFPGQNYQAFLLCNHLVKVGTQVENPRVTSLTNSRLGWNGATASSIATLSITTISTMALSMQAIFVPLSMNDIQHT